MVGSGVRLVSPAPDGPVKSQVDCLIVFADEVEQAPDLAEGEPDQPAAAASGSRAGVLLFFVSV